MVEVKIADEQWQIDRIDEQWISQQINRRQADGQTVCVRIRIHEGDIDMLLSTPTCGSVGGRSRPPRPTEERIFDLWEKRGLDQPDFTSGNLVAFLKQLQRLL